MMVKVKYSATLMRDGVVDMAAFCREMADVCEVLTFLLPSSRRTFGGHARWFRKMAGSYEGLKGKGRGKRLGRGNIWKIKR